MEGVSKPGAADHPRAGGRGRGWSLWAGAARWCLAGRPDVFHVRVVAPLEKRVARLCREKSLSEEAARARLEASDKARLRYLKRSHGVRVDDPSHYHVTVNTGLLDMTQGHGPGSADLPGVWWGKHKVQARRVYV